MEQLAQAQDWYVQAFTRTEQTEARQGPTWLHQLRHDGITRFAKLGFPTTHHEDWKYTNVTPIAKTRFALSGSDGNGLTTDTLTPFLLKDESSIRLVFVNGHYVEALSSPHPRPDGVQVSSLATALTTSSDRIEPHLAHYALYQEHAFVALNTAFFQDGAFVYVPTGCTLERPIHLLFISTKGDEPAVQHPRTLVLLGRNSQATVLESYSSLKGHASFTNAVTELVLGPNAVLDHYKLQYDNSIGYHIATVQAQQDRHSIFSSHTIDLGGALTRNDTNAVLAGECSECTLDGLYLASGQQHVDNHTRIDHAASHCTSRELYKGVIGGKARGVFNGKIVVHKDAHKTDAAQTNKNLLLSPEALVDSKPQLEIFNNDVRCSHGSTIGQLDQEALFFLQARGIDRQAARR
jgi:Fe-S cluster assembly protein SufD